MPLPPDYNTVNVVGQYVYLDGSAVQGKITFTGKQFAVSSAHDVAILPVAIEVTLDVNGEFSVNLPATNDPDIQPNGWTYTVSEQFTRGGGRTFELDIPVATVGSIDITDVAPVAPDSGDPTAFVTMTTFQQHVSDTGEGITDWTDVTNKPATFPPDAHSHAIANVTGLQTALDGKAPTANPTFTGTVAGVTKSMVGLGNVSNLAPADLPVSVATQTALDNKWDILVLAPGAPVPGGTRANKTLIFRTA